MQPDGPVYRKARLPASNMGGFSNRPITQINVAGGHLKTHVAGSLSRRVAG